MVDSKKESETVFISGDVIKVKTEEIDLTKENIDKKKELANDIEK